MIIGIVCVDSNWGIGKDNKLLFHIKEDMNYFKYNTMGQYVVMGHNTLKSLPNSKPLDGRINIVLSTNTTIDRCLNLHSFDALLEYLNIIKDNIDEDIYIIGGAFLYKQMLPYYDKVLVTKVQANKEADTYFPNLDESNEFVLSFESSIINDSGYSMTFCTYRRKLNEN